MVQYVQPFIEVCKNVFKNFLEAELVEEQPCFGKKSRESEWDISGIIGFTGEASGAVVISMRKDLAIKLTEVLTGARHEKVDSSVTDAIGELVNIISGNAKKLLEEDYRLVISLPSIVQGKGHVVAWPGKHARSVCIAFRIFGKESFELSVTIGTATSERTF